MGTFHFCVHWKVVPLRCFAENFHEKHQRRNKIWKSCWLWYCIFTKITFCRRCQTFHHFLEKLLLSNCFFLFPSLVQQKSSKNFQKRFSKKHFPLPLDLLDTICRITVIVGEGSGNDLGLPNLISLFNHSVPILQIISMLSSFL